MSVEVKPSPTHGCGVFAARDFKKGEIVLDWAATREISRREFLSLTPAERNYIDIQNGAILLIGEPERYVNHSCEPNLTSGGRRDIAARDIKKGEELRIDYADFFIPDGSFRCLCESSGCRGLITGKQPQPI